MTIGARFWVSAMVLVGAFLVMVADIDALRAIGLYLLVMSVIVANDLKGM